MDTVFFVLVYISIKVKFKYCHTKHKYNLGNNLITGILLYLRYDDFIFLQIEKEHLVDGAF